MKRIIVLGTLLAATAVAGLHPAFAGDEQTTASHWELHAFADVDGERKVDKKISNISFKGPEDCIKMAVALPEPPPKKEVNGHTIIYGYLCMKVTDDAVTTQVF